MIKRSLFIVSFIFCAQSLIGYNVIFDFNGVLMGTNTKTSLHATGFSNVLQCMIHLRKSPTQINAHLKTKFFSILDNIAQTYQLDTQKSQPAYDEHGNPLPYLMRAWLDGSMTCYEIKKHAFQALAIHPEWFEHAAEKRAISNLIKTIFTPKQFVKTSKIYTECLAFMKACKKQGHNIYALSNWDKESFVLLQEKYPEVFTLFDGIIISGEVNALKPSPDIYNILLTRYHLNPTTCWFIDDQQENVTAASTLGIHGIICHQKGLSKKPDFRLVVRTIKNILMTQRHDETCEKTTALIPL